MQGLLTAFNLALRYMIERQTEFPLSERVLREELIAVISSLAELGEDNPVMLAELAIGQMRKTRRRDL